jgi:hypothetical protein
MRRGKLLQRCGCNCSFVAPSTPKSLDDRLVSEAGPLRPLYDREGFTANRQVPDVSFVSVLFRVCCPAAIGRPAIGHTLNAFSTAVVSVVVDAVDRMKSCWRVSHVLAKVHRRLTPPLADDNSTPTIVGKCVTDRHVTAPTHRVPYAANASVTQSVNCRSHFPPGLRSPFLMYESMARRIISATARPLRFDSSRSALS